MPTPLLCCYFVSYVVFTQFVLLNIVLAVLMNEKSAKEKQKLIYGNKKTTKPAVEEQDQYEDDDIDPIDFVRTTATCQLCGVGDGKTYLINKCYVGVDVDVCALCASAMCANMRMRKNSL